MHRNERVAHFLGFITLLALCLLPAPAAPVAVYQQWPVASLVDAAAVFASKLDRDQARYVRFFSFATVAPERRAKALQGLGFALNSLSTNDLIFLPAFVPGTEGALAWFDLSKLRDRHDSVGLALLLSAFARLQEVGSGPAPFPEPYFHVVVPETVHTERREAYTATVPDVDAYGRQYQHYDGYRWVPRTRTETRYRVVKLAPRTVHKVALSPALNKATAIGLAAVTQTQFPIVDYRWFLTNALVEPRYHELLGLDDSVASVRKLAAVDEKTADRVGAQTRGAALFSEVAHHNRLLERTPTLQRYGRGSFHRSLDYKSSIRLQDVLADLLQDTPDAFELIWTLPNGLSGYYVADGQEKRLDKADADVAANRRSGWIDTQVRTAYHCMDCHLSEKGLIEVDDEVRQFATKPVTLASLSLDKVQGDRGKRIRQKYLGIDFNELLRADQAVVAVAVKAATGGMTPAEVRKEVVTTIRNYIQEPVTLAQLSAELGYPAFRVARAIEQTPGLNHTLPGLRVGRKQRRDTIETSFGQISTVLYLGGGK